MPKTDDGPLGPRFESQLRASLDRVRPPYGSPRYTESPEVRHWGFAPTAFAAGVAALLVLALIAAGASSRAIDLQHRIVNTIQSATQSGPSPATEESPSPSPAQAAPALPAEHATAQPEPGESPEPTQQAEPPDSASSTASPEPSDNHEGSPSPSPTPTDH